MKTREPRAARGAPSAPAAGAVDDAVLAALKRKRRDLARAENVPAFMIFPDRTLIDMARKRPGNLKELSKVFGVGERKIARYGQAFLEVLGETQA